MSITPFQPTSGVAARGGGSSAGAAAAPSSRLMVLFFSDIVGSTDLKNRLGTVEYAELLSRHDQIFRDIIASTPGAGILKDTGDGFFASFATASDAVRAALRFQYGLAKHAAPLEARVGLHLGEVAELDLEATGLHKVVGLAADYAARLMNLASGGQILMTRVTFNDARQFVRAHPNVDGMSADVAAEVPEIRWVAHGEYLVKGADEPVEVFEVGAVGVAPLAPPPDSDKARRNVRPGDEVTLGWRPAGGLELRGRPHWVIKQKLGEGGFGEVWLAEHTKTGTRRVFKFCFEPTRLRGLKREVVLFRLLREALGDRRDIARIVDFQFDESPYFIETEFFPAGTLHDWAESRGGVGAVPMGERVNLVAQVAEALGAAHGVGVLHKDLKPSNILMRDDGGGAYPVLTDFGIGTLTDRSALEKHDITVVGFTQSAITENESSRTGTRLYAPPESMLLKPFTVQGDVYALGVMLYQMVVGDLDRPLAEGWERDVADELLREDIAACVEGDPSRRLASAAELATRLRSHGERRLARHRAAELARAAARRQRVLRIVAVLLVIALGLSAALAVALLERNRRVSIERNTASVEKQLRADAEAARDRATREAAKAAAVGAFLTDMLTSVDPSRTNDPNLKVRDVLDRAAANIDGGGAKLQPEVEAAVRASIGQSYVRLGVLSEAQNQLARAVELARAAEGGLDDAESLKMLNNYAVATMYAAKYPEAERLMHELLQQRERVLGPAHADTADALYNLSLLYGTMRQFDKCFDYGRRALELREKLFGPESKEVAASLQYLGMYKNEARDFAAAEPLLLRSLQLREKILGPDNFEVGNGHNNMGLVYLNTNQLEEAEAHFARAVSTLTKALGESHPNVAQAKANLAAIYMRREQYDQARPLIEDSLKIAEKAKGADHPDLVYPLYQLATLYYAQKNYDAAEATYARTMSIAERAQGKEGPLVLAVKVALAMMYHDNRDVEKAEPLMREVVGPLRASGRESEALQVEARLIETKVWRKEFADAEPLALELRERARKLTDPQQRAAVERVALELLAELYRDWGKADQAAKYQAQLDTPATAPATSPSTRPS